MSGSAALSARASAARPRGPWLLDGLVTVVVLLGLWQGLHAYAGEAAIASPLAAFRHLSGLLASAGFWSHAGATLTAFAGALVISALLGIGLGLILGLRRFAGEVAEPILAGLYSIPKVTLYPVILLVFGLGLGAKVAFGVIHGVIPITLFTLTAMKGINPVLIRTARAMRLSQAATIRTILAPAVLPEIVTGLRVGFSLTLLGVLVGEMFASQKGLGFLIVNGISLHNVQQTTAVILMLVIVAVAANGVLLWLDRRFIHRAA
ncbi:ABC transporter permease [Methylobacterium aquaticum]|uniref:ABC transporter permease n=1 Tax=Methylobacterium aquaticum TaxID=270351 RepID=UPI001932316F|nr:ABC transporter permease subunit [Methylobacterium aquaticum]QRE75026.1 ABC transporter permease subunit [Methylobacterium aquaticum]